MATERLKEAREWIQFGLAILTVLIIPAGLLILKNQRLEIAAEMQRNYVSVESYRASVATQVAENAALKAELSSLSAEIRSMRVTLVRLTDAVKLSNPNP